MRLVSYLMLLAVGVVLVAPPVPGAAAAQPCDKLLTVQDITSVLGPGFTLAPAPVSGPKPASIRGSTLARASPAITSP